MNEGKRLVQFWLKTLQNKQKKMGRVNTKVQVDSRSYTNAKEVRKFGSATTKKFTFYLCFFSFLLLRELYDFSERPAIESSIIIGTGEREGDGMLYS